MKYIIPFILCLPVFLHAQEFNYIFEPDSIPYEVEGWRPFCPWAGGNSEAAPDFCDIDADGDLDLFIGEYFYWVEYYKNTGTSEQADFQVIELQYDSLYVLGDWGRAGPEFSDLDNDGDLDAIIGSGYVTYVENIGTPTSPNFETNRDTLLDLNGNWVFGTHVALVDIDSDGDSDLFGGEWLGHIQFYRNIGTPDSFSFFLEESLFADITEIEYPDPCFVDIDHDNDYDLFIGERYGKIWYYRNDGDSVNYDFTFVTDNYDSIDVGNYSSPEFADIDNDGDYDLFIGSEGRTYYYENIGTPEIPQFDYITDSYMIFEPGQRIQVVDINGDDAPDMIVGAGFYLTYTENTGTSTEPMFSYVTDNFQNILRSAIKPCFVDIDADDDYDLLAGEGVIPGPPTIALYINEGSPTEPFFRLENENYITNDNFFVNVNPGVADIDGDQDYDLFISDDDGHFFLYHNQGNQYNAQYILESSQWQGIQFAYPNSGWRSFHFADIDYDSDLDLLIDNVDHTNVRFYRNIGDQYNAIMYLETEEFLRYFQNLYPGPYSIDIDSDNDLDLFVGDWDGGISFFRNHEYNSVDGRQSMVDRSFTLYPNYPNPFNAKTVIRLELPQRSKVNIEIFNVQGQKAGTIYEGIQEAGWRNISYDASVLSSGVYFYRVKAEGLERSGKFTDVGKMLVLK